MSDNDNSTKFVRKRRLKRKYPLERAKARKKDRDDMLRMIAAALHYFADQLMKLVGKD